jgi:glycosyltransferase involved in cell wall biosynthesis
MRILFANHTASVSGAELALLRLLSGLAGRHEFAVACPDGGPLPEALRASRVPQRPIPAFEASFRLHPLRTPAGLGRLGIGGAALARAARAFGADVLYANTTRAGLMGAVARRLDAPPLVVRLHDHLPGTRAGHAVRDVIAGHAKAVLAVSDYTATRFNAGLRMPVATRVYNCIDHARFDPDHVTPAPLRAQLGIGPDALLLGQVAQITEWKGQDHAIRILAELRRTGTNAHLVVIGDIVFGGSHVQLDNRTYLTSLHRLVDVLDVRDAVHFLGHRDDVPALFAALDISLLPSREEPFGLSALESLAMGTPAFVPAASGAAEIVRDGLTGRVLPGDDVRRWAEAVRRAAGNRPGLERMGAAGRLAAARFSEDAHAEEITAHLERAAALPRHVTRARSRPRRLAAVQDAPADGERWPS